MKRHWKLCCAVTVLVALVVCHRVILRAFAEPLIASESLAPCDTLCVVSGDRCYAVAADLFLKGKARQIVLFQEPVRPLVECQIVEPGHERIRSEIVKRGVPLQAITVAPGEVRNIWELSDRLSERMLSYPQGKILLISDRFHSNRLHSALRRTLSVVQLSHIGILAVRDRRYDESNWWRTRTGVKEFANAYVLRLHTGFLGRPEPFSPPDWKPELWEQKLLIRSQATR
jgi:hypothetical protein